MPSYGGLIPSITVQSLLQLHKPYPCAFMIVERQRIDRARNAILLEALKNNVDYLFFVDDDNPIPPDTLEKFIQDDKDIVSAPILGRNKDKEGELTEFESDPSNWFGVLALLIPFYGIVKKWYHDKKIVGLHARLKNYMLLEAFLDTPEKARKALDQAVAGLVSNKRGA